MTEFRDIPELNAIGLYVQKKSGAQWRGKIVGAYSTEMTRAGYVVESWYEPGSVQLYPVAALIPWSPPESPPDRTAIVSTGPVER